MDRAHVHKVGVDRPRQRRDAQRGGGLVWFSSTTRVIFFAHRARGRHARAWRWGVYRYYRYLSMYQVRGTRRPSIATSRDTAPRIGAPAPGMQPSRNEPHEKNGRQAPLAREGAPKMTGAKSSEPTRAPRSVRLTAIETSNEGGPYAKSTRYSAPLT